jgi:hypothetical protein
MAIAWRDQSWREHALAAIAEGWCPERHLLAASAGGTAFRFSEDPWPGGWCGQCRTWWHVSEDDVVANYPVLGNWGITVL